MLNKTSPTYGSIKIHFVKQPFPKRQILPSTKFKKIADENFEFDEHGRKFLKRVEKPVEKRESTHYKQISPFPTTFVEDFVLQKLKNQGLFGEGLRSRKVPGQPEDLKIAKRIGPCQPAQSAQADMNRNFWQMH